MNFYYDIGFTHYLELLDVYEDLDFLLSLDDFLDGFLFYLIFFMFLLLLLDFDDEDDDLDEEVDLLLFLSLLYLNSFVIHITF